MSSLEAIVCIRSLSPEPPTRSGLATLVGALRRQMGLLGLTGVMTVVDGRLVLVCEGMSHRIEEWAAFAGRREFEILSRRDAPCRDLRRWVLLDPRLAGAETVWLRAELAKPEPDGRAIAALLTWSAYRQEEARASGQGELAWRAVPPPPLKGLN